MVRAGHTYTGDVRVHVGFDSQILGNTRTYWVYLPPNYFTDANRRFPVLYLGDGDAMFDSTNVAGRTWEWQVDETAERLISSFSIAPIIIVGIAVDPVARWEEYTPTYDDVAKRGGRAALYSRMLIEELKPQIDHNYRTLTTPASTGIGGSSLGGLLAVYLARVHPEVFGKVLAFSPTMAWDHRNEIASYAALPSKLAVDYWVDTGSLEVSPSPKLFADTLGSRGWLLHRDYEWYVGLNQNHDDLAWRARVEPALRFLYGSH